MYVSITCLMIKLTSVLVEQLPSEGTGVIVSENSDVKCNAWTHRKQSFLLL